MLYNLTIFVILFSIVLFPYYRYYKNKKLQIFNLIFLLFIGGLYELFFTMILGNDSQVWFKVYPFLEFIALLYFFKKLIGISQSVFYTILVSYCSLYLILYWFYFYKINLSALELFIPISHCLLVYTCSTKWTIQQFEKLETSSLLHFPVFYILSGMILYYSGTFFIFGLETIFRYTKSQILHYFWYVNLLLAFAYRLSFYIAIWKAKKV